ncbi:CDP-6-deoxy-delta-3,4-glucoseen reductase [Pigmentiphaga litoralis]|uniref:CDP-4-dehydro-6-deoxyglucose reductase n=1 Tax=Pigmentiphaga litoralis TaxID=516702 RepID=A0A7Y9IUK7_9BURK|nr:CDP-6-deoxy-delta-3,4-glucoseen reductase [Pigmentiphaga litoralis]NYE23147.1 CDP-4-dehydro-6-deoxyglucose reductase [Pigmentiphaga litoralis]NYE83238.1 CDP-4-dehydro-6-deoxyglucose reductase [Pigmentiphaga litoralis]
MTKVVESQANALQPHDPSATHAVTCQPIGRVIDVRENETILGAALRAGMALPHSCRNGVCGTCKAKIVAGDIDQGPALTGLPEHDREQGFALLCQARPKSAVTVECQVIAAVEGIPVRKMVARVRELDLLAPDVMRIRLNLAANQTLRFLPGQYIDIIMNPAVRRSLSLASAPHDADWLELHLRNYGGPFSTHVFTKMRANDLVRFEGPMGTFFVREGSDKPIIFVGSGTGFAPIKAMIEHAVQQGVKRPMTLYWGGRRPADLYHDALVKSWVAAGVLTYVPVISQALPDDDWQGRTGFVHRAVMEDFPDMSGVQVYACGAPVVVDSARREFVAGCGLPADEFYADAFLPGGVPAA